MSSTSATHYRLAGRLPRSLSPGTELLILNRLGREIGRSAVVPAPQPDLDLRGSFWIGYLASSGVQDIYLALPDGDVLAGLRCCDAARPLAEKHNPYESPHLNWHQAGRYRSTWLRSLVTLKPR